MTTRPDGHGLVLGGGLAGALTAHVLARHFARVTVVDRDPADAGTEPRRGVPQARHSHLLLGTGARALDALLPGTLNALVAAGAHRVPALADMAIRTKYGWLPRAATDEFVISCGRELIDSTVRARAFAGERITVLAETEVVGLTGDGNKVTGAQVRSRRTGESERIEADFVVAATGRSSRAEEWLTDLGYPAAEVETVDGGTAYSTRIYRPDPRLVRETPPIVMVADPAAGGFGGVLLPLEGDRWIATVIGMRGTEPPVDPEGFTDFARALPDPIIAELIESVEPVGPVRGFRGLANRRPRFDRMARWPENFVAVGDAACVLNPVHAHGMSVATLGLLALSADLDRHGFTPGTGKRLQRIVSRAAAPAWEQATYDDLRHPAVQGATVGLRTRVQNRASDRLMKVATTSPAVARALLSVMTMAKSPAGIITPAVAMAAVRGPSGTAATTEATLRPREGAVPYTTVKD